MSESREPRNYDPSMQTPSGGGGSGGGGGGGCFVATAVFETSDCLELETLRRFRDERLLKTFLGRLFVQAYYRFGPSLAGFVKRRSMLKRVVRRALEAFCDRLSNDKSV